MKVVILAAGKGKRMGAISEQTPKPILKYLDKNLIQHKLEQLPNNVTEVFIIIGHLGQQIKEVIGNSYTLPDGMQIPITYIVQNELLGTAHSLWQAKDALSASTGNIDNKNGTPQSFLVLMGDDLYSKNDLEKMVEVHNANNAAWIALISIVPEKILEGECILNEEGYLINFSDTTKTEISKNRMYTGACLLTSEVFDLPMVKLKGKDEYGLPHTFIQDATQRNIHVVEATYWKRITAPKDLER